MGSHCNFLDFCFSTFGKHIIFQQHLTPPICIRSSLVFGFIFYIYSESFRFVECNIRTIFGWYVLYFRVHFQSNKIDWSRRINPCLMSFSVLWLLFHPTCYPQNVYTLQLKNLLHIISVISSIRTSKHLCTFFAADIWLLLGMKKKMFSFFQE